MKDITSASGFISSPNYPTYTRQFDECTVRLVAPANKVIQMWILSDMKVSLKKCVFFFFILVIYFLLNFIIRVVVQILSKYI